MKNSNTTQSANTGLSSLALTIILFCSITLCVNSYAINLSSTPGTAELGKTLPQDTYKSTPAPLEVSDTLPTIARLEHGFLIIAGYLALWMIGYRIFRSCRKNSASPTSPHRCTNTMSETSPTLSRDQEARYKDYLNTLGIKYSPRPKSAKFKNSLKSGTYTTGKSYSITHSTR